MTHHPTYKRVIEKIRSHVGQTADWQAADQELVKTFVSQRVREGWEAYRWPELLRLEKRYYQSGMWVSGSYAADAIVYHDPSSAYYKNTSGSNTTEEPGDAAVDWELISDFRRYVPMEQAGRLPIAEVYNVWAADPREEDASVAKEMPFRVWVDDGVDFGPDSADVFWLYYRQRPYAYFGKDLDTKQSYAVGVELYDHKTGDYWITTETVNAGETPSTHPQKFEREVFPYRLEDYVVYGVYADWLTQEENLQMAQAMGRRAKNRIEDEMKKVVHQQSQLPVTKVRHAPRPRFGAFADARIG